MKKILLSSLSLFICLAIKSMENPRAAKRQKIANFEEFQQLPKEIQKEVLLQFLYNTAQNDSLVNVIENIKNAMLVSKEWKQIIDTQEMTNKLVDKMLKNPNIQQFFEVIGSVANEEIIQKQLILIALETKYAQHILSTISKEQIIKINDFLHTIADCGDKIYGILSLLTKEKRKSADVIFKKYNKTIFYLIQKIIEFFDSRDQKRRAIGSQPLSLNVSNLYHILKFSKKPYPDQHRELISKIKNLETIEYLIKHNPLWLEHFFINK